MTRKRRAVVHADGRVGYPDVLQYRLVEGPEAGALVDVPPTFATHPHPDPVALARALGHGMPMIRPSCDYVEVIHDRAAYDELAARGFWNAPWHTGPCGVVADSRPAPQS